MCIICQKQDDFSLQHMEAEIKKLRFDEMTNKAKQIKDSIRTQESWLKGDRCDGFEKEAVEESIGYLKRAQYLLSKYM